MAKLGVLSMQRIVNYGSFLQAYGLKSILEELGNDVEFVDYHVNAPILVEDNKSSIIKSKIISKVFEALSYDAPMIQKLQFILYKKNFSKKYHDILGLTKVPNYTPQLDVLLIGSDEVFNCIQKNPNVGYSLELFGANNNAKKVVSYAASFGNTTIDKLKLYNKEDEIKKHLEKFDKISVRDKNSYLIAKALTEKNIECHLDPVLAYDYMEKCNKIHDIKTKEKYLILYAYSGRISAEEAKWISKYAKEKKLKIYAIGGVQKCADRFIDCSPFEVLSYFKNAEEIITDTFHGTIFSIITKRQFTTLVRKSVGQSYGNEEKLTDLLDKLYLTSRVTYDVENIARIQENIIDYTEVMKIIAEERKRSYEYLNSIFE